MCLQPLGKDIILEAVLAPLKFMQITLNVALGQHCGRIDGMLFFHWTTDRKDLLVLGLQVGSGECDLNVCVSMFKLHLDEIVLCKINMFLNLIP